MTGLGTAPQAVKKSKLNFGPVSAIVVTLAVYFGAQIIAGYAIIQYLLIKGVNKDNIPSEVDGSVALQFFFILLAEISALLLLWLFLRKRKISWPRIGVKKPQWGKLFYALPAYAVYFSIIALALALLQVFVPSVNVEQSQQVGFETASGGSALFLVFLALVALPAITEEITVRGFLYSGLRTRLPFLTSAILTSLIFGLAHLFGGKDNSTVWTAAVDTLILSMVLVYLREKTGNIWAGVIVHITKNSLAFLTLFIFKPF
ncbi:MAG TPA: CPBP family intramembrane glutamic endopeptidase [Candidatus Saccharimonadales bacterium]|nr:CPBP family intramembrane glutamic endopeptidase [Candidatus Saccharimonadales bacterium]